MGSDRHNWDDRDRSGLAAAGCDPLHPWRVGEVVLPHPLRAKAQQQIARGARVGDERRHVDGLASWCERAEPLDALTQQGLGTVMVAPVPVMKADTDLQDPVEQPADGRTGVAPQRLERLVLLEESAGVELFDPLQQLCVGLLTAAGPIILDDRSTDDPLGRPHGLSLTAGRHRRLVDRGGGCGQGSPEAKLILDELADSIVAESLGHPFEGVGVGDDDPRPQVVAGHQEALRDRKDAGVLEVPDRAGLADGPSPKADDSRLVADDLGVPADLPPRGRPLFIGDVGRKRELGDVRNFTHLVVMIAFGKRGGPCSLRLRTQWICEDERRMAYVITEPCVTVKDASCVDVCPVDCIYTTDADNMYFIHPDECIDCGACESVCPVSAIFPEDAVPDKWKSYIEINKAYFNK